MKEQERLQRVADDGSAVDRLIDEALTAIARPHPVDLRQQVLARLAGAEQRSSGVDQAPRWRLGLTLAGAMAAVVLAVVLWWPAPGRENRRPEDAGLQQAKAVEQVRLDEARRSAAAPRDGSARAEVMAHASPTLVARQGARPEGPARFSFRWPAPAAASGDVVQIFPVDPLADAGEPALPGAPAGELGEGVKPMAALRPIPIAPIVTAPPISELAEAGERSHRH